MIDRYVVDSVLGQGGFGITYRAYDPDHRLWVAIKEYFPQRWSIRDIDGSVMAAPESERDFRHNLNRFWEEAQLIAQFEHPYIVKVLRRIPFNGTAYIVLEFIEGGTLEKWALTSPPPPPDAIECFAAALLDALETVHARNIWHRDIKPLNILLRQDGMPVLIDFGSAREDTGKAMTAMLSVQYGAYEQYSSAGVGLGPYTDIYGAAATLYRVLCGRPPLDAMSRAMAMDSAQHVPISQALQGSYRQTFLEAIDWGLETFPDRRPQTVAQWRGPLLEGWPIPGGAGLQPQASAPRPDSKALMDWLRRPLNAELTDHDETSQW